MTGNHLNINSYLDIGTSRDYTVYLYITGFFLYISSFHEMGIYDFPAVVDFVLNKTGRAKLDIVGYSLGATIALVGLSEKPAYNSKIDKLVLMAPTTRMISYGLPVSAFYRGSMFFKVTINMIIDNIK